MFRKSIISLLIASIFVFYAGHDLLPHTHYSDLVYRFAQLDEHPDHSKEHNSHSHSHKSPEKKNGTDLDAGCCAGAKSNKEHPVPEWHTHVVNSITSGIAVSQSDVNLNLSCAPLPATVNEALNSQFETMRHQFNKGSPTPREISLSYSLVLRGPPQAS